MDTNRNSHLVRNYGITLDEFNAMLRKQHGVCAICEGVCSSGKNLSVDHDHQTGAIRGLLCSNCNRAIGLLGDRHDWAQRAADYLVASLLTPV